MDSNVYCSDPARTSGVPSLSIRADIINRANNSTATEMLTNGIVMRLLRSIMHTIHGSAEQRRWVALVLWLEEVRRIFLPRLQKAYLLYHIAKLCFQAFSPRFASCSMNNRPKHRGGAL